MSDTEKNEGKALAWTEEAKYQFLLRVIAQFKDEGKQINWSRIDMPGRTTKSLQNQWTKINKAISELEESQNGDTGASAATATPKKTATPRKPRAKKAEIDAEEHGNEAGTPASKTATPRKRRAPAAAAAAGTTPKRGAKARKNDEDDNAASVVKTEAAGGEDFDDDEV